MCPKGYALKALEEDPDRLRSPLVRVGTEWREASWDEAFRRVDEGLAPLLQGPPSRGAAGGVSEGPPSRGAAGGVSEDQGRDSVALYLGNPNVHNLAGQLYVPVLARALMSRNFYSASSLDQLPKHVSCGLMFGDPLSIPIPDLDRCNYLLILGANPMVSQGSLMTAPNVRTRLRSIQARGGRVVVLDPRRTRTAQEASEHHFIRPGSDAYLLMGLVHLLLAEGRTPPVHLCEHLNGFEQLGALAAEFSPAIVAARCGLEEATVRRLASELSASPAAAVYGRLGTCTQEFGTLASWLVEVLNVLTGNLDREGGAMFPKAAAGARNTAGPPGVGRGFRAGAHSSRVRGLQQWMGEWPTATLADEILTPGPGQVRALITVAGNPCLSAPDSKRLTEALAGLDFMVSVDCYLNETTRHAHVILPPPTHLARSHYDVSFSQLAVRNVARFARAVLPLAPGQLDEWEILLRLSGVLSGLGPSADLRALDDRAAAGLAEREIRQAGSRLAGREVEELLRELEPRRGPERLLDLMLRSGPYGLTLADLEANPDGIDLGPLKPRIPEVLRTPSGRIELAPPLIVADVARLAAGLRRPPAELVLIGRRDLRSNNSWMHNLPPLAKGPAVCTLLIHPTEAARLKLVDGARARLSSATASLEVDVECTDTIMPGVVSLPHGWGHDAKETRLKVARERPGVNVNRLLSGQNLEPLTGTAIQNSVKVSLVPLSD